MWAHSPMWAHTCRHTWGVTEASPNTETRVHTLAVLGNPEAATAYICLSLHSFRTPPHPLGSLPHQGALQEPSLKSHRGLWEAASHLLAPRVVTASAGKVLLAQWRPGRRKTQQTGWG